MNKNDKLNLILSDPSHNNQCTYKIGNKVS